MSEDDVLLIESVAHEMMTRLGYNPHIVGVTQDALVFSHEQIAEFTKLNEEGIKKMQANLAIDNPKDLERQLTKKAALEQEAVQLSTKGEDEEMDDSNEEEDLDEDDKIKVCSLSGTFDF